MKELGHLEREQRGRRQKALSNMPVSCNFFCLAVCLSICLAVHLLPCFLFSSDKHLPASSAVVREGRTATETA